LESLPEDTDATAAGIESAWADEADRRLAEYRAGGRQAMEWKDALNQVRDALPARKSS
jgi:hypothetical protein